MDSKRAQEITIKFAELKREFPDQSPAIVAIRSLTYFIRNSKGSTVNYLAKEMKDIVKVLKEPSGKSKLAIASACAQFIRFATLKLATIEIEDMSVCKKSIEDEGGKFIRRCERSADKIARLAGQFMFEGARVLVHSDSRIVLHMLKSVPENMQFSVYVTNADTSLSNGFKSQLEENQNIDCHAIHDSEVGYMMESIDLVLVGAEAVVKNGGIINQVGTLSTAICAKEMNKPMYVLAESFKFSMLYPLNQEDVPREYRIGADGRIRVDYTPPKYLTLLISDRGLLTPTAVCDELIEMYV